jgi:hypothetical protein
LASRRIAAQILVQEFAEAVIDHSEFVAHGRSKVGDFGALGREVGAMRLNVAFVGDARRLDKTLQCALAVTSDHLEKKGRKCC